MREECNKWDNCNAPLCPLDSESLEHCVWYPGEEICTKPAGDYQWIKTQRKIARVLGVKSNNDPAFEYGYFTVKMLDRNMRVTKATKGLDPNKEEAPQLKRWLKQHKGLKPLSEAQRQRLLEMGYKRSKNDTPKKGG